MDDFVGAIRRFNRFYTRQIGLLGKGYLDSSLSLTQGRVLYELAHRDGLPAVELARELALDPGYLSRILAGFRKRGLIARRAARDDGRESRVFLTAKGRRTSDSLDQRAREQIGALTAPLTEDDRRALTTAARDIQRVLGGRPENSPVILRSFRSGDMGHLIYRHAVLYRSEYGYDETFEALVAEICAKFIQNYDPQRERCWIAERDGAIAGCVFAVKHTGEIAKLRLLLVEPSARGLGLGTRLVEECIRFAAQSGYRKIVLWTQSELIPARAIYKKCGFTKVAEEPHHSFGKDLIAETWERGLP